MLILGGLLLIITLCISVMHAMPMVVMMLPLLVLSLAHCCIVFQCLLFFASDENISFLHESVTFAQLKSISSDCMQVAQRHAIAGGDSFALLGNAILHKCAMVVPTDAVELQMNILWVTSAVSDSKHSWL